MRKDVTETARKVLEKEPYARINDGYLIRRVIEILEPDLYKKDFKNAMDNMQFTGISIESITRARRKYLEQNPEQKVDKVEKARKLEEEKYYMAYANHIPFV